MDEKRELLLISNHTFMIYIVYINCVFFFPHKLIFEKEGVYLHTNAKRSNHDTTIPGFIRIVERVSRVLGTHKRLQS